jgi:hypothetical protein
VSKKFEKIAVGFFIVCFRVFRTKMLGEGCFAKKIIKFSKIFKFFLKFKITKSFFQFFLVKINKYFCKTFSYPNDPVSDFCETSDFIDHQKQSYTIKNS